MEWSGGEQILIAGESAPESDRSPSLAYDPYGNLLLVYVGKGGENLYLSSAAVDVYNPSSWQDAVWTGNKRVKLPSGSEPTANDCPAMAWIPLNVANHGIMLGSVYIYTEHSSGRVHALFYTGDWLDAGQITAFPDMVFHSPMVTVCGIESDSDGTMDVGLLMHLVVVDKHGIPWYSSIRFDETANPLGEGGVVETNWQEAQQLELGRAEGVQNWSLTSVGDTAYLFGFTETFVYVYTRGLTDETWTYQQTQLAPEGGINPPASVGVLGTSLNLIYTPKGKTQIFTASGVGTPGDIVNPSPVSPNGVPATTNAAPAAVQVISGDETVLTLLIAYKGHNNDKLYFAWATQ